MGRHAATSYQRILVSAGKLFAEHGYDKVTTRMIAQTAKVRVGAIHYHFQSKENLYLQAFRYALNKGERASFSEVMAENPQLLQSKKGQAELIRTTVLRYFRNIFNPQRPRWETRLLVREILTPSTALPALARSFIESHVRSAESFCKRIKPEMDDAEAAIWADTLHCHAFFYTLARKPIEMTRGHQWLNDKYYYKAARMVARFMIQELELPMPEDLRTSATDLCWQ